MEVTVDNVQKPIDVPGAERAERRKMLLDLFGALMQRKQMREMIDVAMESASGPVTFTKTTNGVSVQVGVREMRQDMDQLLDIALSLFDDLIESGFAMHWCQKCRAPLVVDPADPKQEKHCLNPGCEAFSVLRPL